MRIERILAVDGGILTVLDQVTAEDDEIVEKLSEAIPVAIIDMRTLAGLARLGGGSPVAEQQILYSGTEQKTAEPGLSELQLLAAEKLKAATVLIDQNCAGVAVDLLLSALLVKASDQAQLTVSVTTQDAGVWIYSEALPKGFLTQDDAALIMRALALAQSPSVPENMVNDLCLDVELFVSAV